MDNVVEKFNSLTEFLNAIGKRKTNELFENEHLGSNTRSYDFTLTSSYEESVKLALKGYKEGLDKMMTAGLKISHMGKAKKHLPSVDVVGFAPHIPNAITGIPKSMINTCSVEQKAKVLTILYYSAEGYNVKAEDFIKAGKNMLNLITSLETQGYRVGLNCLITSCKDQRATVSVQIKNWRQPSNPLKIAYPFLHPSFLRRNGFRWLETHPNITDSKFIPNYGYPIHLLLKSREERIKYYREIGVLQPDWFYVDMKDAVNRGVEELVELMGIK
jgi:hypothetical protein